jgi:hypothetical protein
MSERYNVGRRRFGAGLIGAGAGALLHYGLGWRIDIGTPSPQQQPPVVDSNTEAPAATATIVASEVPPTPTVDPRVEGYRTVDRATEKTTLIHENFVVQGVGRYQVGFLGGGTQHVAYAYRPTDNGGEPYAVILNAQCLFEYADRNNLLDEGNRTGDDKTTLWPLTDSGLTLHQIVAEVGGPLPSQYDGKYLYLEKFTLHEGENPISCHQQGNDAQLLAFKARLEIDSARDVFKEGIKESK